MFAGIYQSGITVTALVAFYLTDFMLIAYYDQQRRAQGSGRSWDFTMIVVAMALCLVAQPVVLPGLGLIIGAWWGALIQILGAVFLLGGLGLHWWARVHLRQFYAERVEIQPGHTLVDGGPYAYVRHPIFSSFFMLVLGLLFVNPSLPTLLVGVYTFWDFFRAAEQEEILLNENLPGYTDYMTRTSRFVPRILRHSRGKRER